MLTLNTPESFDNSNNVFPLSSFLDSVLGSTENEILENSLELENYDMESLETNMIAKGINTSNLLSILDSLSDDSNEFIYCDFYEVFNPELIFTIYQNNIQGYLEVNFSSDPTDYIYEEYGCINKILSLSIDSTEDEISVYLAREFNYNYDDVDDEIIIEQIQMLEKNNTSDKVWERFIVNDKKLNFDQFNKKFSSHFNLDDIWL